MKRSEMIKIIDQCIYDYTDDDFMIEEPSELVYKLLEVIEKAGMMPPRWIPEDHGYIYSDEPSGEPNDFKISIFKWEPEDE